jgi:inner membrane protein
LPTVFTHALVGGAFTQVAPAGLPRWKVLLVFVFVAIVPDLDVIAFSLGIPYAHPLGHRGFSHSLLFAGVLSFLICLAFFYEPSRFSKDGGGLLGLLFWLLRRTVFLILLLMPARESASLSPSAKSASSLSFAPFARPR